MNYLERLEEIPTFMKNVYGELLPVVNDYDVDNVKTIIEEIANDESITDKSIIIEDDVYSCSINIDGHEIYFNKHDMSVINLGVFYTLDIQEG